MIPQQSFAPEYTPELSKSYLAGELGDIEQSGRVDEGRASAEAASRGLLGQAFEGSAIGQVRAGTASDRRRAIGGFNLDVANKQRDERLYNTRTADTRAYESTEAEKNREFQKSMAQMGYMFQDSQRNNQNRADKIMGEQGMVEGAAMKYGMSWLPQPPGSK